MELKLKRPTGLMALESITGQDDGFGERLESLMRLLCEDILHNVITHPSDTVDHPVVKKLESEIFSRLGIKTKIITTSHAAAIIPFYANKNHVFLNDYIRGDFNIHEQQKLLKNMEGKRGTVNLEKAKVTGIFSEYAHPLYVNFFFLVKTMGMNASEIAAVTLHELGHAFYACYYANRTDETNQVLASIAKNIMGSEHGEIEYIYRELEKVNPNVTKGEVDKLLNGPRVVAGATWFKIVVGIVRSQFVDDTYNQTAFEQRADNFAARFGYGKELVLALDKLYQFSPEKSASLRLFVQMMSATTFVIGCLLIFSLIATASVGLALFFAVIKFIMLQAHREDMKDHTYDSLKVRYLRIRQDVVDQLKDKELDKALVKEMLDALTDMDYAIKSTSTIKVLPEYIANFLFSGARQAEKSITDQQLMEELASNDLFVQAAQFRVEH